MSKYITLDDIANVLNVSKVTVSKALRDHPDISKEMKKKVKQIAQNFGYTPNQIAKNLSSQKSNTIGVVVPDVANSFFAIAVDGIIDNATEKGYSVLLSVSRENKDLEIQNIMGLLKNRVDGLLISVSQETKDTSIFKIVRQMNTHLVFFDRCIEKLGFSCVKMDNKGGAFRAVEYAIKLGYTKFGHFAGFSSLGIGRERFKGFEAALKKYKIPIHQEWIVEGGLETKDGYNGFKKLYEMNDLPEIIFTVNGPVAYGIYDACRELNLIIPNDLSIIGFGHRDFARMLRPRLTILNDDPERIGKTAIDLLIDEILHEEELQPQEIVLPIKLEVYESCWKQ